MTITVIPQQASLKAARGKAATISGIATVKILIPGTINQDLRIISSGRGWFENIHPDDTVKVTIVDDDNILGYGVGAEIGSYVDDEVPADNRGHYICEHIKFVDMTSITYFGEAPAGFYLKVEATKGDLSADTFRCNIKWGI